MKTPEQLEQYWLEVLEALWELCKKYPEDEFIQERIEKICWNLGYNLDIGVDGFFEIAEGDPKRESAHPHYAEVVTKQLERLAELRKTAK